MTDPSNESEQKSTVTNDTVKNNAVKNDTVEKPARERFRRYHRAQDRRRKAQLREDQFSRAVFSVAGVAAAIAIALGVLMIQGPSIDQDAAANLTNPWMGPFSRIEVFGLGFIALLATMFIWRTRKRK